VQAVLTRHNLPTGSNPLGVGSHGVTMRWVLDKVSRRLAKYRRKRSVAEAHLRQRGAHREDYIELDNILGEFHASGGLSNKYRPYKLWNINKLIYKYAPGSILEFGSGSSTVVLSRYARQNNARILSIDEDNKWVENTKKLCNINTYDKIDILFARKRCYMDVSPPEIRYDVAISEQFDFVFIDGPSLETGGINHTEAINSNVFDLPHLPKVIVVDIRMATAKHIADKYANEYIVQFSDLFSGKPVKTDYNYLSVFLRKEQSEESERMR